MDESYDSPAEALKNVQEFLQSKSIDLPYTMLPKGFETLNKMWGIDGYDLVLIGPDGKVVATRTRCEDLESLVK